MEPLQQLSGPVALLLYIAFFGASLIISLRARSRGGSLSAEAEKAAREELIVKHWEEFQALLDAHVRKSALDALEAIPSPLREALIELEERQAA